MQEKKLAEQALNESGMLQEVAAMQLDGRNKACVGLIADLEKAMKDDAISSVIVIVQDVPTKIDIYAWAKRKNHRVLNETPFDGVFKIEVLK